MIRRLGFIMLVTLGGLGFWLAVGTLTPHAAAAQTRPIFPRPGILQIQASGISTFTAIAGDARGEIKLRWMYGGNAFRGAFLVERSANRRTWTPVTSCSLSYSMRTTTYACTDTKLTSGRAYYYRVCLPASGSKTCTSTNATVPRRTPVTAP